jgi:ABC-type transporter Mla MlaB component
MIVETFHHDREARAWSTKTFPALDGERTLVLAFGAPELFDDPAPLVELRRAYPRAQLVGCSSAGEIVGPTVRDHSLSVAVARFDKTPLSSAVVAVASAADSFAAGQKLARQLARPDLRGVLVLSEGLGVNGSQLVAGINAVLPDSVVVTGGLSGDGTRFKRTWVAVGDKIRSGVVVAVGFHGDHISIGHGSRGGWDKFGPERVITRSEGNVLHTLDGKPALALYKEYLGDKAAELPASGLLFPLAMRATARDDKFLVRTLLAVDHEKQTMTFAGDLPKGHLVQLMKANFDRLIDGASLAAASAAHLAPGASSSTLAVAISCVGRRIVLGDRTEEEVEAALEALPRGTKITGFYSYGEISPYTTGHCDLHNQTMTLTVFGESETPLPKRAPAVARPALTPAAPGPRRSSSSAAFARVGVMKVPGTAEFEEAESGGATVSQARPPLSLPPAGMRLETFSYDLDRKAWSVTPLPALDSERTLVLAFGAPELIDDPEALRELRRNYPRSHLIGCSSAGEIVGPAVRDRTLSVSVARFQKTPLVTAVVEVESAADSFAAGQKLAAKLDRPDLRGVLVLSEGLGVNGSQLVAGINAVLPDSVVVTGGLSGDGTRFKRTWVAVGDKIRSGVVVAVGFHGDHISIGHGSRGGWDKFGPERVITRSEGNVLHTLDGKPALALYKEYLGDKAAELPASGLLFPLAMRATARDDKFLVRTVLAVDHDQQTMTFAGDLPRGHLVQLMKANFERLVDGASLAAGSAAQVAPGTSPTTLAVAISCVGRRIVLGDRAEEEVEAVLEALPKGTKITGFYSYGEISPYATGHADLHNQTMTLTLLSESETPLPPRAPAPRVKPPPTPGDDAGDAATTQVAPAKYAEEAKAAPAKHAEDAKAAPAKHAEEAKAAPAKHAEDAKAAPVAPPPPASAETPLSPGVASRPPLSRRAPASQPARAEVRDVAPPGAAGAGAAHDLRKVGGLLGVRLAGRLTEAWKGAALAKKLEGAVVFDLAGVERITSFGVREWLQMLKEAEPRVTQLYLARCSEPVVNQVSMIRKFAGGGQVVSFWAPYRCDACGSSFERLVDVEHDADAITAGEAPAASCPRCAGAGSFDDDAQTYFGFAAPHAGKAIPREVREALAELAQLEEPVGGEAVEKLVEGSVTRVKVNARLDGALRWNRILDGIEGQVVFDLGGAPSATADGAVAFEAALRRLAGDVESIRVEGCPRPLAERLAGGAPPGVTLASVIVDGHCDPCAANRAVLVDLAAHAAALGEGRDPAVPCKRCSAPLSFAEARPLLARLARSAAPPRVAEPPRAPEPPRTPAPPAATPAPAAPAPPGASKATVAVIAALGAAVFMLAINTLRGGEPPRPPLAPEPAITSGAPSARPAASAGWAKSADLPPAWVERLFAIDGEDVFVVGRGGPAPSEEAALAQARSDALARLVAGMIPELAGSPVQEFVQARAVAPERRKEVVEPAARRYLKQVGATATPERVDAVTRQREEGTEAFVRYRLSKQAFAAAVEGYKQTAVFQNLTVARFFPELEGSIRTDGELLVVAVQKSFQADLGSVRPGDVILDVNGHAVSTVDGLARTAADEWARTPPGVAFTLQIESLGARRTLRVVKSTPAEP